MDWVDLDQLFSIEFAVHFHSRKLAKRIGAERKMYAVIKTGGKQYRVEEGETLKIEKLENEPGSEIEFDKVLLVQSDSGLAVGKPYLEGGKVTAKVLSQGRLKKVHIIKFRRRKHHMKKMGHRQYYTEVQIAGISAG